MSGLGKGSGLPKKALPDERCFPADMLQDPVPGWPVEMPTGIRKDISGVSNIVRSFPHGEFTGVGFSLFVPKGMGLIHFRFVSSAGNKPEELAYASPRLWVKPHEEDWTGPSAVGWIKLPDQLVQSSTFTLTLKSVGAKTERYNQFELTRNLGGPGDLEADWLLHELGVTFS